MNSLVQEFPNQPTLKLKLAEVYEKKGQNQEAIVQYDAAGDIFLGRGDRKSAIKAVEAILSLNPEKSSDYKKLLVQLRDQQNPFV